jgi:hypothetical protein
MLCGGARVADSIAGRRFLADVVTRLCGKCLRRRCCDKRRATVLKTIWRMIASSNI